MFTLNRSNQVTTFSQKIVTYYSGILFLSGIKGGRGVTTYEKNIIYKSIVESGDDLFIAYFKAFDAGANIFAGFEVGSGLFLQLNAQLGLVKINPTDSRIIQVYSDKLSIKNSGFGLSLGYRF
jgi:hypothetical protein